MNSPGRHLLPPPSGCRELEQLSADPADTADAMRTPFRARFAELHTEREQIEADPAALAKPPQAD